MPWPTQRRMLFKATHSCRRLRVRRLLHFLALLGLSALVCVIVYRLTKSASSTASLSSSSLTLSSSPSSSRSQPGQNAVNDIRDEEGGESLYVELGRKSEAYPYEQQENAVDDTNVKGVLPVDSHKERSRQVPVKFIASRPYKMRENASSFESTRIAAEASQTAEVALTFNEAYWALRESSTFNRFSYTESDYYQDENYIPRLAKDPDRNIYETLETKDTFAFRDAAVSESDTVQNAQTKPGPNLADFNKRDALRGKAFVRESTDLFSNEGEESDYIFPSCQEADQSHSGPQRDLPSKSSAGLDRTNPKFGFVGPFRYLGNYKNPCWMEHTPGSEAPTTYCVPYFYLAGAPKAGTSDLFKRIGMHPEVVRPTEKETRWFDRARFAGSPHFSSFLNNFQDASRTISLTLERGSNHHQRIVGDGSPSYFFDNRHWRKVPGNAGCSEPRVTVASHIRHLFAGARVILILRSPSDRLYSSYLYNRVRFEDVSNRVFHQYAVEAVRLYRACFARRPIRECANNASLFAQSKVMLAIGMYSVFVQDWLKLFPKDQVLVLSTERYTQDMEGHLSKIFRFLGLRALNGTEMGSVTQQERYNKGQHYALAGPMLPETRALLDNFYKPFNIQLAALLADPDFLWLS